MKTAIDHREYGPKDASKVFRKLRTCSRTFFHILNREFGHPKELEELAADSLAGGILQQGQQCGSYPGYHGILFQKRKYYQLPGYYPL